MESYTNVVKSIEKSVLILCQSKPAEGVCCRGIRDENEKLPAIIIIYFVEPNFKIHFH